MSLRFNELYNFVKMCVQWKKQYVVPLLKK